MGMAGIGLGHCTGQAVLSCIPLGRKTHLGVKAPWLVTGLTLAGNEVIVPERRLLSRMDTFYS